MSFVVSHPSRKNKDAARVGHPALFAESDSGGVGFQLGKTLGEQRFQFDQCG
jgi:hypothetical protein